MKQKFKWLLALVAMVASVNLMAETYTISFVKGTTNGTSISDQLPSQTSTMCNSGSTYIASFTGSNVYYNASGCGIRIAKSKEAGSLTITLSNDVKSNVKEVIIYASAVASGNTLDVTPAGTVTTKTTFSSLSTYSTQAAISTYAQSAISINGTLTSLTFGATSKKYVHLHQIDIITNEGGPTLESIYFTNDAATKLSYTEGDVFNPAGLVVMGKYSEGDDKDVTEDVEWSFSPETLAKTTTSVTVTASIDGVDDAQKVVNGLTVAAAPKYTKVTANKTDWSGEYLLVYEGTGDDAGKAFVWTGEDVVNGNVSTTISNNQIAKPAKAATLTVAAITDGYSIQVNGGTNDGKYIGKNATGNGMDIGASAYKNTISFSNSSAVIAGAGGCTMRYNTASDQKRFRYFGSGQQAVQLYEKVLDPISSAVTFTAPTDGSLVIKNGATPITTGATVQDGTVLDVTFGMTPAEAYKDVAIKVTNTTTSADVTSTVYNSETQKITMPRYPITVAVTFTKLYKISLVTDGTGTGTATMNGGTTDIYVDGETQINLVASAVAPNEFTSWSATENIAIDKENEAETSAYASGDGTITATFGISSLQPLDAPTLSDPTNVTYSGVTLNWQELANAEGYNVEILLNDETVASDFFIGETSWTPEVTLQANTTYTYTVQGVGDGTTYAEENNPKAQSTVTTADYPAATLTLSENGVERAWGTGLKLNSKINLPTDAATEITGKVLVGYVAENFEDTKSAEPDNMLPLGAEYTMTATEAKLFAVYATKSEGDAYYQKITAAETDWSGKYLIVSTDGAMDGSLNGGTGGVGKAQTHKTVTENDKVGENIKASFGDQYYMIIEKTGNNYYLKSQYTGEGATPYIYRTSNSNGMDASATASTAIGISWDDGIKIAGATSGNGASTLLKYNKTSGSTGEMFRFYKDGGTSQQAITLYKRVANIDYSAYVTKGTKALGKPSFDPEGGEYNTPQTITLSATEGDIYYTINDGEEKLYEEEIKLENRGQYVISAYAKKGDAQSEPNEQTYTLDWAYTLAELVAEGAPTTTGRTVTVILTDEVIESIVTSGSYVNGFFTMVGDKKIEVYCKNSPSDWEAGGKVSGTVTCPWKDFQGTWELCPTNWDWASYTAPAKITSLVITGDVDNKNYTAGQKLDFTGLTVTGVYSDATEEDVTEDVVWTEVTLEENQTEATATAKLNSIKTGSQDVSESKTITGLTVGAKVELSKIEITTEASKKDFFVGRNFNHEGIVVTATYSNGSTSNVTNACDFSTPTLENKGQETVTITYSEGEGQDKKEVTTSYTINVKYMNLNDLVAEDIATNTSVKVAFSDVEITGFYKNSSDKRAGVYVNVIGKNGSNIELYSSGTPSATLNDWQEGGKLASKGNYISGTWKYYDGNDVWEIDFGSAYAWATNIEYTAPEIYPTEISMSIPTATVKQSKSLELEANFIPANATVLNNLEWSSDNNQVTVVPSQDKKSAKVTVAPDATVGTATITVKVDDKDGNELSATCVITIQEYSVPHYGLYSGAIEGGDYIFKANGQNYYMNNTNNNGRLANVANENNPEIVNNIITTDAESFVWQIAKSGDYWTIQNLENSKYVSSTAKSSAGLVDDATANTALWTITYDATNEVYTFVNLGRSQAASDADKCYLRNNNNSGWACYSSTQSNAITLYKAGFTPAAALQSIEIKGDLEITEYFQGKSVKYDGLTVEGTYSDGDKKTITEGIVWSANPATFTEKGDNISVTITATVQTKNGEITDDANFTVKVVESQKVSYGLVTSVNTLYDGATIILGAVFGTATDPIYAVNQGFDTKYLAAYRSNTEGSDLEYADEVMKTAYASEITLKKVEEGWKLLGEDGKYINGAGDLSQTTDVAEATVWTISIEDGVTKIANDNNVICYNTSAPRFKTYTGTSQTVINCGIYMKNLLPVRTGLTIGQYTTYCEPYAVVAGSYSGATFWNIADKTYMSDGVRLASITIEQHTGNLEAGVPYIMLPEATQLTGVQHGEAVDAPAAEDAHNGLVGVFATTMFGSVESDEEAIERGIYIISDGTLYLCGNNCGVYGNRAYIQRDQINPMPLSGAPRRVIGNPNGTPTNLNGLNGNVKAQKALIDGHIYILRDNKMYNAQGLFVK